MYEVAVAVFWILVNLLNRITPHYSKFNGAIKWILGFIEAISVTRSKGIPGLLKGFPVESDESDKPPRG